MICANNVLLALGLTTDVLPPQIDIRGCWDRFERCEAVDLPSDCEWILIVASGRDSRLAPFKGDDLVRSRHATTTDRV